MLAKAASNEAYLKCHLSLCRTWDDLMSPQINSMQWDKTPLKSEITFCRWQQVCASNKQLDICKDVALRNTRNQHWVSKFASAHTGTGRAAFYTTQCGQKVLLGLWKENDVLQMQPSAL